LIHTHINPIESQYKSSFSQDLGEAVVLPALKAGPKTPREMVDFMRNAIGKASEKHGEMAKIIGKP